MGGKKKYKKKYTRSHSFYSVNYFKEKKEKQELTHTYIQFCFLYVFRLILLLYNRKKNQQHFKNMLMEAFDLIILLVTNNFVVIILLGSELIYDRSRNIFET